MRTQNGSGEKQAARGVVRDALRPVSDDGHAGRQGGMQNTKRAEISVFRRALHYRLQTPQSLVWREFGADPGGSGRYGSEAPKCVQMTTSE
ncbi:hypothetical protein [Burkholderia ubonensis]|uniref:hypothetical protein n=1 Tax=Burkholderia ubonensis TaxID=101571 RepID=UPI0015A55B78|nr:hypothetical protein [Burkholderia ubonensis]